jgi:cytochrome P450
MSDAAARFPVGAAATLEELEGDAPYPLLARLREREPVSWLPALGGWLVTRRDLALEVMRDAQRFTVQDPRFTTARVVGPSMLSLDGPEHVRHREPFVGPFRLSEVRGRLAPAVRGEVARLLDELAPTGRAELRSAFAGPLAAAAVTRALGFEQVAVRTALGWYEAIVAAVTDLTAGRPANGKAAEAVTALGEAVRGPLEDMGGLDEREVAANAAVVLFGGIETTEGMIANAVAHLLADPAALALVRESPGHLPGAVEESLRLEPAAAVVDRYATARVPLAGADVAAGDLMRISITAANRDPATFETPDRFVPQRDNAGRHLAFAAGPHVCVGMHLARLEAHVAVGALLERLPGLRLADDRPPPVHGLVFRKPPALDVLWDI